MRDTFFILALLCFITTWSFGQDAATVSDEELKKYAVTVDSVNDMKDKLLSELSSMIKESEKITNARYNELSKIIHDEAQLAEAKATPEEINFVKDVMAKKEEGTVEINEAFQSLARDYVGVNSYNKVKKALAEDPALKSRYEAILKDLEKE